MIKKLLSLAILVSVFSNVHAQNMDYEDLHETYNLEYRTFRVSMVPGLSTNGIDAKNYASRYSLNLLAGYNGALDRGFEFGTLLNMNRYYAHGGQIAGIGNYSGGEISGITFGGVFNYSSEEIQGIQFAGVANIAKGDMQGIQFAGTVNWAQETAQGMQFSGIANYAGNDMQGIYLGGAANITTGNMQGLIFSGLLSYAGLEMQGIAASGGLNYSESMQGIALASININRFSQGMQIGTINIADEVQGIQLGLINYAREMEGAPVGLISFYGNGRQNIDFWTSDAGFTNFGLKLGTEEVYNMISIGVNPAINRDVWLVGWSIGRLHKYRNHFLHTDFSIFKINEGDWTKDLNLLYKYRLQFGKEVLGGLKVYGGPTFNMLVSRIPGSSDYTWYRLLDFGANGRDYIFWIGYSFGVELF